MSTVAQEDRTVRHPRVEARRTHPEGSEHSQEQEYREGQARPVLRYYREDPTLRLGRVDEQKIQVRTERDEHARERLDESCPDRSQASP